jgi:peptidoglycan hydrolase-like protein with peptidoglycan-binding domain
VLVGGGYYYQDSGYWYPAWGYDPNYESYDYDGPIYTYGNLLPDQVIINVQHALKELGYYAGDVNGSLGDNTRRALAAYQQDYGLDATGAVDEATVRALGLI